MYKNPLNYTKEDISEVMNKPIKIYLSNYGKDEIIEEITGVITKCVLASNSPFLPASFLVQTQKGERTLSIAEIKRFEDY